VLALYGIQPNIELTKGGHVRFTWKAGHVEQTLLAAKTPSDWRGQRNAVARVRRMLKEAGITKINPRPVALGGRAQQPTASPTATLEARVAQLESDVAVLLDILTNPPAPKPKEVRPKKKGGRRLDGWIFRSLRYDAFLGVNDIADAAGRPTNTVAVQLSHWKKKGFIEHIRGKGWRKTPKVESLDTAAH